MIWIKFPQAYEQFADNFYKVYFPQTSIYCPSSKMHGLKERRLRKCRFCGKLMPDVTFKKDAHIIPEALGNRYLISDFECDQCNKKFGFYEDELSKYLGITRTITKTKTKSKIPTHKRPQIEARAENFYNAQSIVIESRTNTFKVFEYDSTTNERTIVSLKAPYTPIKVYKAILKIALCLLTEEELKDHKFALEFLQSSAYDSKIKTPLYLSILGLPGMYEDPIATLFKKIGPEINTQTHTFVLFYKSYQFQIFLPFNELDKKLKKINVPILPPVFDGTGKEDFNHTSFEVKDFNNYDVIKDEKEYLRFKIDPDDIKKLVAFNPKTKTFSDTKFGDREIKKMIIVDKDFKLNIDDLK